MRYLNLFVLSLWCACQKSTDQKPAESSLPNKQERAQFSSTADVPPSDPKPATTLPDNYRTCVHNEDCIVVDTLFGLTTPPKEGDTCTAKCTFGISKHALEQWELIRTQTVQVPCDMEMEECPPKEHWIAQCIQNQCVSRFKRQD